MSKKHLQIWFVLAVLMVASAGVYNYLYLNKSTAQSLSAALISPTSTPAPDDVLIYFSPLLTNVLPGQTFAINVYAKPQIPANADTATPYNIQGADLKIQYDAKAVEVVQIQSAGDTDASGVPLEAGSILSLTNGISDYGNLTANPPVEGTLLSPTVIGGTIIFNVESRAEAGQNISYENGTLLGRVTFRLRQSVTPPATQNTVITTLPGGTVSRINGSLLESYPATIAQSELNPPVNTPTPVQDSNSPTVSITNPTNNQVISRKGNLNITANVTDDSGIARVEFYINNVRQCTDTTAGYSCSWPVPGKPNARYEIRVVAYDTMDNQSSQTVTVSTAR